MTLVLQPNPDGSPDEHHVMHGGLRVGRIYKRKSVIRSETQWLWSFNASIIGPEGIRPTGLAGTLEDAKAALNVYWEQWLSWAKLSESGEAARAAVAPQVISVVISKSDPAGRT
jgi:hypothetical protein